jgi:hypothetical protein
MCAGCVNNAEFAAMNAGLFAAGARVALQRFQQRFGNWVPLPRRVTDNEVEAFLLRIGAPLPPAPAPVRLPGPVPVRERVPT